MSITRESEKLGTGYVGILVVCCAGSAIGTSLIVFDLVEAWILGAGFGASAITGLGLVRAGDKTTSEIWQWLKTRRIAWFWRRMEARLGVPTIECPLPMVGGLEDSAVEPRVERLAKWDPSVIIEMLNELSGNSRYNYLLVDEVAVAGNLTLRLEISNHSPHSALIELSYSISEGKLSVSSGKDFGVEIAVDIVRDVIPSLPFHPDLSADLLKSDRADGVYLEFARALFRTKAAKNFFTNSQISEARNRLRETASVGVKKAAAEVTRLIRRPRRRLHAAEARAPDRQEIKRWLAGKYRTVEPGE